MKAEILQPDSAANIQLKNTKKSFYFIILFIACTAIIAIFIIFGSRYIFENFKPVTTSSVEIMKKPGKSSFNFN